MPQSGEGFLKLARCTCEFSLLVMGLLRFTSVGQAAVDDKVLG
jgi:hypothetical protein